MSHYQLTTREIELIWEASPDHELVLEHLYQMTNNMKNISNNYNYVNTLPHRMHHLQSSSQTDFRTSRVSNLLAHHSNYLLINLISHTPHTITHLNHTFALLKYKIDHQKSNWGSTTTRINIIAQNEPTRPKILKLVNSRRKREPKYITKNTSNLNPMIHIH